MRLKNIGPLPPPVPAGMLDARGAARYLKIDVEEFLAEVQMGHLSPPRRRGWQKNNNGRWCYVALWNEIQLAQDAVLWRLRGVTRSISPPSPPNL